MKENNRSTASGGAASGKIPGRGQRSMRSAFQAFRKRKHLVLAVFLILCLVLCFVQYNWNLHTASTILSLDYEEASKGLTPNRTRFNIFEIRSSEVMKRLIAYAGLEGRITPEELSECVSVEATHDKSVSGDVYYISTSFIVSFTNRGMVDRISAEDMLSFLCRAYRDYFVEHYGYNHSILSFDVDHLAFSDEYLLKVDLLELKCSQLKKIVQLRGRESKNYQDPISGNTFSALEQRLSNFEAYDLARLRSYIIENGIASDRTELIRMLDYKMRMDSLMQDKLMAAYEEDIKGIQMYDAAMSAVVMIPTEDENLQYYMSRTKTGMDNMALHAEEQLTGAMDRTAQIEYNAYLTEKLEKNTSSQTKMKKADDMILEMETLLDEIASDIQAVDTAFSSSKARNYIGFSENDTCFAERIGLFPSILFSVLVLLAVFTLVSLRKYFSDKEKTA